MPNEWALALQQLPAPTPPPLDFCPPPAPKPRKIRGTHGENACCLFFFNYFDVCYYDHDGTMLFKFEFF